MHTKIVIDGVATFRNPATIDTDKRVNLVYGLNGTGKSTIARLLRKPQDPAFLKCSVTGMQGKKVLVFNEDFVRENFYESPTFKGIFSLSKKNKDAEDKIAAARSERDRLEALKAARSRARDDQVKSLDSQSSSIVDTAFEIKRKYSGGDRVLEFCLIGLMGSSGKLFDHLRKTELSNEKPSYTVADLQKEVRDLGPVGQASPENLASPVHLAEAKEVESNPIFAKPIVGANSSSLGDFINKLQNSDWVRSGMSFIDSGSPKPLACPFCQKPTIDDHFFAEMRAYFDQEYTDQIAQLNALAASYSELPKRLPDLATLQVSKFFDKQIETAHSRLEAMLRENQLIITSKLANPSVAVALTSTVECVESLIAEVNKLNASITAYNKKISNREASLADIKRRFWLLMRWEYDQSARLFAKLQADKEDALGLASQDIDDLNKLIATQDQIIRNAQKQTVNVDAAISRINAELIDLGVVDFKIEKHSHHMYRLERPGGGASTFESLSEGEKMLIALLYFCELCDGNEAEDEVLSERVVVIDDPISSMSHMYVFNVGRLLRERFIDPKQISQVFILTHSLYFFYELTNPHHEQRTASQRLFRVLKNPSGSSIVPMKYEDIQNDYQAYWQIINDRQQNPALIANCMRNVVEYFFGFVEKQAFANVFQKPELSKNKFQAFNRYMNRESHSFGQNVFDLKEFNYDDFREGLKQVFETCGYSTHYSKMTQIH